MQVGRLHALQELKCPLKTCMAAWCGCHPWGGSAVHRGDGHEGAQAHLYTAFAHDAEHVLRLGHAPELAVGSDGPREGRLVGKQRCLLPRSCRLGGTRWRVRASWRGFGRHAGPVWWRETGAVCEDGHGVLVARGREAEVDKDGAAVSAYCDASIAHLRKQCQRRIHHLLQLGRDLRAAGRVVCGRWCVRFWCAYRRALIAGEICGVLGKGVDALRVRGDFALASHTCRPI
mmetsp:Transcript_15206/g.40820  ORF Transcript_15206/g.40820 Transcript_15206/m.40820 type:complete len:231 (+) Transcript_15206:1174-1866(+)